MRPSICECGPDQEITEICENVPFLEKSLHFIILEQVLMQNVYTENVAWASYYPVLTDCNFLCF